MNNKVHVIPVDDLREHITSVDCFCKPITDDEDENVIVHNAMDKREEYENGRNLS